MEELIQDHPDFRPLKKIVKKGGITYKFVERYDPPRGARDEKGNLIKAIAIYEVYGNFYMYKDQRTGYEVFKIRIMKGGNIGGNPIPPGEKYPSDEDIGRWGSSFHGGGYYKRAWDYYNELKKEIDESCTKS